MTVSEYDFCPNPCGSEHSKAKTACFLLQQTTERHVSEGATFGGNDVIEYVTLLTDKLNVDKCLICEGESEVVNNVASQDTKSITSC